MGDLMAQKTQEHDIDQARAASFTILGVVLVGPVLHFWYKPISISVEFKFLDCINDNLPRYGFLARVLPATTITVTGIRLVVDQLIFAPLFIPAFCCSLLFLEGKAPDAIFAQVRRYVEVEIILFLTKKKIPDYVM